jgi:hypothetical protein
MKTVAFAITFVLGVGASSYGAEVTGKLVDQVCYGKEKDSKIKESAAEEAACARACAAKGNPVALVTEKGDIYEVVTLGSLAGKNNAKLVPHMSHTVTLTGDIMDTNGKKMIHATALKVVSK